MFIWIKDKKRLFKLWIPRHFKIIHWPGKGLCLFSDRKLKKGEKIPLRGRPVKASQASPESVQIDEEHFLDTVDYVAEDFINHACRPNTKIDLAKRAFVVLRDIPPNTEITFHYLTTEYDLKKMKTNFVCRCGAKDCYGKIQGFKYLSRQQKKRLKPLLSPFLLRKLEG